MNNNTIAIWGFLILSIIGVYFSYQSKLLDPMDNLLHMASAEAVAFDAQEKVYAKTREFAGTYFHYTFKVDGKEYSGGSAVDERIVDGQKITVQYNSKNPGINGAELQGHALIDLFIFMVPFSVLVVCSLVLILKYRKKNRAN